MKKIIFTIAFAIMLLAIPQSAMASGETQTENVISATHLSSPTASSANVKQYKYQIKANQGIDAIIIPVKASGNGTVLIDIDVKSKASQITATSWYGTNLKKEWMMKKLVGGNLNKTGISMSGIGIHYVMVSLEDKDIGKQVDITLKAYEYPEPKGGNLKAGKWVDGYGYVDPVYYKITLPSDGYITVEQATSDLKSIGIYRSNKQPVSSMTDGSYDKRATYVLKKGTYYIKVDSSGYYKVQYHFTAYKIGANTKKTKAITLKKNRAVKECFGITEKVNPHWYKIKLTSSKKIQITFSNTMKNGASMNCYIYNGKKYADHLFKMKKTGNSIQLTSKKKLEKGTYYIEAHAFDCYGTAYSIKWKTI